MPGHDIELSSVDSSSETLVGVRAVAAGLSGSGKLMSVWSVTGES